MLINFSNYSHAQKFHSTNKIAKDSFNDKLHMVEIYLDTSNKKRIFDYEILTNTVLFLEQLTGLKSDLFEGFDPLYEPSKENYEDWKTWYKLNKKKLYLYRDTVKIKRNPIPVRKSPKKYFKKKLRIVKESLQKQEYNEPEYSNAIQFLVDLTNIVAVCVDPELNLATPCERDILYFETWFKRNKDKLFWDVETHSVKLK